MRLWLYYARGSIHFWWKWRITPLTLRCERCKRRRWTEEIVIGCGWCDRCWEEKT